VRVITCGGIGAIHKLVCRLGLNYGIEAGMRIPELGMLYWEWNDTLKQVWRARALPAGNPMPRMWSPRHEVATEQGGCPLSVKVIKEGEFANIRLESGPATEFDRGPKHRNRPRRMVIVRGNPSVEEGNRHRSEMMSACRASRMNKSTCGTRSECVAMEWLAGLRASGMISPFILRAPTLLRTDWNEQRELRPEVYCSLDNFFTGRGDRK